MPKVGLMVSTPTPSNNFAVLMGPLKIPFSKISSIEIAIDTEVLVEGGENLFVHSLSKPQTSEKILVMERGTASSNFGVLSSVIAGQILRVGTYYKIITIIVMDQYGYLKKMYLMQNSVIKKRSFSNLDAMNASVFVESVEIIYQELTEIPAAAAVVANGIKIKKLLSQL